MGVRIYTALDWLDSRSSWEFLCILYVTRWVVLVPYMIAEELIFTDVRADLSAKLSQINPVPLFVLIIIVSPLLETLLECSLPFFILSKLRRKKDWSGNRPWLFVIISAALMALLHPVIPTIVPAFITGVFLAYCYGHFALRNTGYAIVYTTAFHGAINIVGYTMIVLSRL